MSDNICLIDMDGTLFDYEGQLHIDLRKLMSPGEIEPEGLWDDTNGYLKARIDLIKSVPGWWRNLPKLKLGWDIYYLAVELGFDCHILTKGPSSKPHVWTEKVECVRMHFGDAVSLDIVGKDKSARYGRVLVDDYPPYAAGWLQHRPRGLVIMPASSTNESFVHPNVIHYNGENLQEVRDALVAVLHRKSGEHWK